MSNSQPSAYRCAHPLFETVKPRSRRPLIVFLAAIVTLVLALSSGPAAFAQTDPATFYINGQTGRDANAGTSAAPWQTLQKALATIHSGDTVIFAAGLYRQPNIITFGPAGTGPNAMTNFRAAPGARVILTGATDNAIQVYLGDYVRVEGLWMGGVYNAANTNIVAPGGQPVARGKEIVNCVIFGYHAGMVVGAAEQMLIQDNLFVDNGEDRYSQALYISSGLPADGAQTQHVIIDHNLFIGNGKGYGYQAWHRPTNLIITRNFVANQSWGSAMDNMDNLIANNLYWKQQGLAVNPGGVPMNPWGVYVNYYPNTFINNIFGPHGWMSIANIVTVLPKLTLDSNAFTNDPVPAGGGFCPNGCGKNPIRLLVGSETAQLGQSAAAIDAAVEGLRAAFLQPVNTVYANAAIDTYAATLRNMRVPAASPLYQKGVRWFDAAQPMNLGPDSPAPTTQAGFWAAFQAMGFRQWNRFGLMPQAQGVNVVPIIMR